jgi:hypothetical protein
VATQRSWPFDDGRDTADAQPRHEEQSMNGPTAWRLVLAAVLAATFATPGAAYAQVHGRDLMTEEERLEQRRRMQDAETWEERERVREEHHEQMKERARERGVELPEQPPAGRGPGSGFGPGQRHAPQGLRRGYGPQWRHRNR